MNIYIRTMIQIDKNGNYEKKKYDIMLDNLPPSDFRTAFGNNLRGCLIEGVYH